MRTHSDFVSKTNDEYAAWCKTFYAPEALDARGMQSLHGLWAWQEQERRIEAVDVRKILLDVVPGPYGMGQEVYAKSCEDVVRVLTDLGEKAEEMASMLHLQPSWKPSTFAHGTLVRKRSGSQWEGRIVGRYSTALTPDGYAVESSTHAGSVQIYPAHALEAVACEKADCGEAGCAEGRCGTASCLVSAKIT